MPRKITLQKINTARARQTAPETINGRPVDVDVIEADKHRPIVRVRVRTPITPKAVRDQLLAALHDYPQTKKVELIKSRLTPLDRYLTDDQAAALEKYAVEEENLERMNIGSFAGDRVQSSPTNDPMTGHRLDMLSQHQRIKTMLGWSELASLRIWCQQMTAMKMAPSFAEAGWTIHRTGNNKQAEQAWFEFLARVGARLSKLYGESRPKR